MMSRKSQDDIAASTLAHAVTDSDCATERDDQVNGACFDDFIAFPWYEEEDDRKPPARPSFGQYGKKLVAPNHMWHPLPVQDDIIMPPAKKSRILENEPGEELKRAAMPDKSHADSHNEEWAKIFDSTSLLFPPLSYGDIDAAGDDMVANNASAAADVAATNGFLDPKLSLNEIFTDHFREEEYNNYSVQSRLGTSHEDPKHEISSAATITTTTSAYRPTVAATSAEKDQIIADKKMAKKLQAEADEDAKIFSEVAMSLTPAGKAWKFVERILFLLENNVADQTFHAVAKDDLVFMAEKMFQAQEKFRQEGKPIEVDIGFHYTTESNMSNIQTDGLLTRLEREASNITAEKFNGAVYGEGIYTGDDPQSFKNYGDVGLIVARLKGTEMDSAQARKSYQNGNNSIYARVVGRKRLLVLQYSKQCVAMVRYPKKSLTSPHFQDILKKVQQVVDDAFNDGKKYSVPFVNPSSHKAPPRKRKQSRAKAKTKASVAPSMPTSYPMVAQQASPRAAPQNRILPLAPISQSSYNMTASQPMPLNHAVFFGAKPAPGVQGPNMLSGGSSNQGSSSVAASASTQLLGNSTQAKPSNQAFACGTPQLLGAHAGNPVNGGIWPAAQNMNCGNSNTIQSVPPNRRGLTGNQNNGSLPFFAKATGVPAACGGSPPQPVQSSLFTQQPSTTTKGPSTTSSTSVWNLSPAVNPNQLLGASTMDAVQTCDPQGCWGKIGRSSLLAYDPIGTTSLSFTYTEKDNNTASQDGQKHIYTNHTSNSDNDCSICLSCLKDTNVATLCKCGHEFHLDCLKQALAQKETRCPNCRVPLSEPWGKMPHGTMNVEFSTSRRVGPRSGFSGNGVITINYDIPSGIQENHHPNPGQLFLGDTRVAYLPDCREGRRLLTRLVYAFTHGMTFVIGTSLTTGRSNVITWASIHHKTSLSGGVHGFPDQGYFLNCNEELDSLGVPKADE